MAQPAQFRDVVCLGCGCVCDDLQVAREGQGLLAENIECGLAQRWLAKVSEPVEPLCQIKGQDASLAEAAAHAKMLLTKAKAPLVCGLSAAATDAQRAAVSLADKLRAYVDWTTRESDAATALALQTVGAQTASLGEVAQRADLVIFWRCDPATSHPRHFKRYSLAPASHWLPNGRSDRTVVAVGAANTRTAAQADIVLDPRDSLSAAQHLRAVLRGIELDDPPQAVRELAQRVRLSRYAAFFYDDALLSHGHAELVELTLLAQQSPTRVAACPLGTGDNAHGAQSVLAWQTGYPLAVSFARGWPEYGPDEFTTHHLLARREVDAALVVSENGLAGLNDDALAALRRVPSVVLSESDQNHLNAEVLFRVAPLGAAPGGNVYRSDGVPLPLDHTLSNAPSHSQILRAIF